MTLVKSLHILSFLGIFEPFGRIQSIQLMKDPETDRSKGYGFIVYHEAEDAKKAMEHLNGFELAGRPMKVLTIFFILPDSSVLDS